MINVADIAKINFVLKPENMIAIEFVTKEDIYIDESERYETLFRLEHFYKKNKTVVAVAWHEDYDVMEDATYLFNEDELLNYFLELDKKGAISDHTACYIEHLEESKGIY